MEREQESSRVDRCFLALVLAKIHEDMGEPIATFTPTSLDELDGWRRSMRLSNHDLIIQTAD